MAATFPRRSRWSFASEKIEVRLGFSRELALAWRIRNTKLATDFPSQEIFNFRMPGDGFFPPRHRINPDRVLTGLHARCDSHDGAGDVAGYTVSPSDLNDFFPCPGRGFFAFLLAGDR